MSDAQPSMIAGATPGWMVVRIGEARLAVPIESVGEVLPVPEASPVPMAPRWVVGVTSVRGEIVPLVDACLRVTGVACATEGRVVLVTPDDSGERVGLIVDGIAGLIDRVGAAVTEKTKSDDDGPIGRAFVAARVTSRGSDPVPLLDLAALLDPAVAS